MTQIKPPNSRRNLDIAIDRFCSRTGREPGRIKRLMASVIVGQMLSGAVAKGGNALKIRYGMDGTRYSKDLDAACALDRHAFVEDLEARLGKGWSGFSGRLVIKQHATPRMIPEPYLMQPYDVKLLYNGKSWMTIPLEVGHNEIGDAENPEMVMSRDAIEIFSGLGLQIPGPVPCMRLEHQVAQKLHAVSAANSERAHDLIDLQIITSRCSLDYTSIHRVCERLFAYRQQQAWPPTIEVGKGWDTLYASQAAGLEVLPDVIDAVAWANRFIGEICAA